MKVKNRENQVNMATSRIVGLCANAKEGKRETRERGRIGKDKKGKEGKE